MANRYFVNPEDAEMKPEREWVERGIHLNNLIEISPCFEEDKIVGFAMHINVVDLADMMVAALNENDLGEREEILTQASRISNVMLKYYEDREAAETISDEVKEAIEQAKQATKQ